MIIWIFKKNTSSLLLKVIKILPILCLKIYHYHYLIIMPFVHWKKKMQVLFMQKRFWIPTVFSKFIDNIKMVLDSISRQIFKGRKLFWSNSDQKHFFPPEIYTFPPLVSQVANLLKPLFLVENLYRLLKQMVLSHVASVF